MLLILLRTSRRFRRELNVTRYLPLAAGVGQGGVLVFLVLPSAKLFWNLELSLPVSRIWQ